MYCYAGVSPWNLSDVPTIFRKACLRANVPCRDVPAVLACFGLDSLQASHSLDHAADLRLP